MNSETFFKLIREKGLGGLSQEEAQSLFHLAQSTYDEIVRYFLTDTGEYARSQASYHYSDSYRCQIDGCALFAVRPNPELYQQVLASSLLIGDPSSCRDAVAAMLQVQSPPHVALDFLDMIDKHASEPNSDEIISRIMGMFYWLGTSPIGLTRNNAWPGYYIPVVYSIRMNRTSSWDEKDAETGYPSTPASDPIQARDVSLKIIQKMLDLFEANNANQTARSVIAQLPLPDKEYLSPLRSRIIRAFISANTSSDEYVRHRVSYNTNQSYIQTG